MGFCTVSINSSPPHRCLLCTGALSAHVWSMHPMCGGAPPIQLFWTEWSQRPFVSSTLLFSLTVSFLLNSAAMLHPFLYIIAIFMLTALLNLLTACLPPSCGLAAQDFLLFLTPMLSKPLMQELTSTFTLSSLPLVNSGTVFLGLYFLLLPLPPPPSSSFSYS